MEKKLLYAASTGSHLRVFHLPYLHGLQELGWTVHCACGRAVALPRIQQVTELPLEKKMSAPGNIRAALQIRKQIKEEHYGAVIVHTTLAAFFIRLAVLGLKDRPGVINMVHGYLFDDQTNAIKRAVFLAAELLTAPVTDLLLTMNRWDYDTASRYRLGR